MPRGDERRGEERRGEEMLRDEALESSASASEQTNSSNELHSRSTLPRPPLALQIFELRDVKVLGCSWAVAVFYCTVIAGVLTAAAKDILLCLVSFLRFPLPSVPDNFFEVFLYEVNVVADCCCC